MLLLDFVLSKVLSKILVSEFRYDYIKARYSRNLRLLFTDTDSWYMELKPNMFMKTLVRIKKCLILVINQLSQKIMMIQIN